MVNMKQHGDSVRNVEDQSINIKAEHISHDFIYTNIIAAHLGKDTCLINGNIDT